jgi:hypothetical protein
MKKTLILFLMAFVAVGGAVAAEEKQAPLSTAGLVYPGHGPQLLQIAYEPVLVGEGDRTEEEMANIGRLSSIAQLTIGENEVKAGCYPCGFAVDDAENYYFVVSVGEEQVKTKMKVEEVPGNKSPCLMMSMLPAIDGANQLLVIYGKFYSLIPVKVGDISPEACKAARVQSASCCAESCPAAKAGKCPGAGSAGAKEGCPGSSEGSDSSKESTEK